MTKFITRVKEDKKYQDENKCESSTLSTLEYFVDTDNNKIRDAITDCKYYDIVEHVGNIEDKDVFITTKEADDECEMYQGLFYGKKGNENYEYVNKTQITKNYGKTRNY